MRRVPLNSTGVVEFDEGVIIKKYYNKQTRAGLLGDLTVLFEPLKKEIITDYYIGYEEWEEFKALKEQGIFQGGFKLKHFIDLLQKKIIKKVIPY